MTATHDLIVVGAGIVGSEAALACARAGLDVLLVTTSLDTVYNLVGDGAHLTPPAGTLMAELCEEVWADLQHASNLESNTRPKSLPHAEGNSERWVTTWALHRSAKRALEHHPKLHLLQSSVSSLLLEDGAVKGVSTWEGVDRFAPSVALCAGSFLGARLNVGELTEVAGRLSEMAYDDLFDTLKGVGFAFKRETLEAHPSGGSLPYTVTCHRFAPHSWDGRAFTLDKVAGLYAAGVCASGYLPYEAAAQAGQDLARAVIAAHPRR